MVGCADELDEQDAADIQSYMIQAHIAPWHQTSRTSRTIQKPAARATQREPPVTTPRR